MSRKFIFCVAITLMVAVLFVGCGASETTQQEGTQSQTSEQSADSNEKGTQEPAKKDKLVYGYIAYQMSDIWNEYSSKAFQYAAEKAGVDVIVLDSQNDVNKSIAAMESLIQQEVDGISIFPISPEQGAQLIAMANEAGIPITVENIDVADVCEADQYIASVGCVYGDIGYAAIKWLAENVENAKVFYCAGAVGGGVFEAYKVGVDKALEEFSDSIELVGLSNSDSWSTEDGLNLTQNFINSGVEFNCIFANNDQLAQGCYQALAEAGMEDIPVVSTGGSPDAYNFLKEGIEAANMTAPVSIQGVQTFKNLHDYVTTGKVPEEKFQSLPVLPVSGDDLSAWIDWSDYAAAYDYVYGK